MGRIRKQGMGLDYRPVRVGVKVFCAGLLCRLGPVIGYFDPFFFAWSAAFSSARAPLSVPIMLR